MTIDSDNMLRFWNLEHSTTYESYRLPISGRVTFAAMDNTSKSKSGRYLAVGSNTGEVKILNLQSGGILYDFKPSGPKLECSALTFFDSQKYWLFAGFWQGKMTMWNQPEAD